MVSAIPRSRGGLLFEVAEDEPLVLPEGIPEGQLLKRPLPWSGGHAIVGSDSHRRSS
jgi:hypothetical protein